MAGATNNGDFLACIQDLEDCVPAEQRKAFRKASVHWMRLEEDMREMKEVHTNPDTGKLYNVQKAFANLDEVVKQSDKLTKAYWWASGVGTMLTVVVGLSGYIVKTTLSDLSHTLARHDVQMENDRVLDQEQTLLIQRLQVVQEGVVKELTTLHNQR